MSSSFMKLWPLLLILLIGRIQVVSSLECHCEGHCPEHRTNDTCENNQNGSMCYTHVEEVYNEQTNRIEIEYTYGCLEEESATFTCKGHLVPHKVSMNIECCNTSMCNLHLKPKVIRRDDPEEADYNDYTHIAVFLTALIMCMTVGSIILLIFYRRRRKLLDSSTEDERFLPSGGSKSLQDLIDCSITSGSGSGLPKMVQRTIARQVERVCSIGKGRYGEVYKASWKGEFVACKVFYSTEEASWTRETEIYQTNLLRHDHILGFIAADIGGTGGYTQLLLITNYHENGSLYDYLMMHTLDEEQAVEMALTACSGLCHLHSEILGKQAKPAIAHRDIKSKNILVKRDGTCCLADFGLAVRFNKLTNQIDIGAHNTRVGTKRYMAPEVLDETLKINNFNSYKQADMYSFGLVLWEITTRIALDGIAEPYRIPFHDSVPSDPSFEEMKKVVCISGIRPDLPERWERNETTKALTSIITELWCHKPSSRLPALRVKKSLSKLEDQLSSRYSGSDPGLPV